MGYSGKEQSLSWGIGNDIAIDSSQLQDNADLLDKWGLSQLQVAWDNAIQLFRHTTEEMDITVAR